MATKNINSNMTIDGALQASSLVSSSGVKVSNDSAVASSTKAGTIRYRETSTASYVEICQRISPSEWVWTVLQTYSWVYGEGLGYYTFTNSTTHMTDTQLLDTSGYERHLTWTRRNCLLGDGTAKLTFSNLPTYDSLTIIEDGVETTKTLTALELTLASGKKYNYAVFKNAGTVVSKFPLMEYDSDYTVPSTLNCYDVIGSASCVVTSGDIDNVSKADGLSYNFKYGFAKIVGIDIYYPKKENTSGYGGITTQSIVEYLPFSLEANQYVKAPTADTVFITNDTDEQFYDAGTPINVNLIDLFNSTFVSITITDNIINLLILND